jgi:hypothetical protein
LEKALTGLSSLTNTENPLDVGFFLFTIHLTRSSLAQRTTKHSLQEFAMAGRSMSNGVVESIGATRLLLICAERIASPRLGDQ